MVLRIAPILGILLPISAATSGCGGLDEPLFSATRSWETTWEVGSSPEVVVGLRGGPLYVTSGPDGRVKASFSMGRVSKVSQDVADRAVRKSPGLEETRDGDTVRIVERAGNTAQCSVHLAIPKGSSLDLTAAGGDVCVGCPNAVVVTRLKARCGEVGVLSVNLLDRPAGPTRLDLDGLNLTLSVNGTRVNVGPPTGVRGTDRVGRWHYRSE